MKNEKPKEHPSWKNPQRPETREELEDFHKYVLQALPPQIQLDTPNKINEAILNLNKPFRETAQHKISIKQLIKKDNLTYLVKPNICLKGGNCSVNKKTGNPQNC